jgi:hypothetical protein
MSVSLAARAPSSESVAIRSICVATSACLVRNTAARRMASSARFFAVCVIHAEGLSGRP